MPHYKYCIVPKCTNTSISTPEKLFFNVPKDPKVRKKWCTVMKRDDKIPLSCQASRFCCEDHFDVEADMENYVKYKLVGGMLKLKKGVLPQKFDCQKPQKNVAERPGFKKSAIQMEVVADVQHQQQTQQQSQRNVQPTKTRPYSNAERQRRYREKRKADKINACTTFTQSSIQPQQELQYDQIKKRQPQSNAERQRKYRKALREKQKQKMEDINAISVLSTHTSSIYQQQKVEQAERKRYLNKQRQSRFRARQRRKVTEAKKYESPSTSRADDEKEYEIEINQEVHEDPLDFEKVEVKIEPTDDGNDERIQERSILKVTKAKKYESPSTSKADDENELKVEIEIKQETNEDPFEFEKVDVKVEPTDDVYEDSIQEKLEFDVPIKNEYDESLVVEEHSVSTFTDEESSQHLN